MRRLTGWNDLIRFRRMLGLFAFFYGSLHLLTYLWLDKFFALDEIVKDVDKRPFITVGFTALTLHGAAGADLDDRHDPPAGRPRWQRLHRLVYVVAVAGWSTTGGSSRPTSGGLASTPSSSRRCWATGWSCGWRAAGPPGRPLLSKNLTRLRQVVH